jgi:flavin reductase (DIM6/NTAB) family NADH-FMN oxidoreductase RutF
MIVVNRVVIESWERFYRANFINCLSGFKPVSLLGTINRQGQTNLGVFSNIIHIGADPAMVGYINRPREAAPHTITNIESSGFYTINHIHFSFLEQAHQASAKYPEGISEFDKVGLSPEFREGFPAPFVRESVVKYALSLQEIIPVKINGTFLVIGKIETVFLAEGLLQQDGFIDLQKAGSVCSNGLDGYYATNPLGRFRYAKPGVNPLKITGHA